MTGPARWAVGVCVVLFAAADPSPAAAQCDPRTQGWSCYERWCSSYGGRVNRGTTECEGAQIGGSRSSSGRSSRGSGGGGGGGGYSAAAGFAAMQAQLMTSIMQSLMSSFQEAAQRAQETQQRVRAEAEQVWQRQLAEERERLNRAAAVKSFLSDEAQASMDRARAMAARMAAALGAGDGRSLPDFFVYEDAPDLFGVQTLKPVYTGAAGALNERQRLSCASGLQGGAAARGLDGVAAAPGSPQATSSYKDALYLTRQARTASGGGTLDVACPIGSVPAVGPGVIQNPEQFARAQRLLEESNREMEQTFEKAFSDAESVTRARATTEAADQAAQAARARQEEAQRQVEALKARPPAPPPAAAAPGAPAPAPPPAPSADDDLLAEAQARLRRSSEALAEAEKSAQDARQALGDAQRQMAQTNRQVETLAKTAGGAPAAPQ